jgi:hypothetical protein
MATPRSHGPFEMMGFRVLGEAPTAGVWGERRRNGVSGKIGDMSFFTAIEW